MASVETVNGWTLVQLDAFDTWRWAHRSGAAWPGSVLSGFALDAEFDSRGDLVWYQVEDTDSGAVVDVDVPVSEFDAITTDFLPVGHPARRDF